MRPSGACLARLPDDSGLPVPLAGRLSHLILSRPRRCSLGLRPVWPTDPQKGPFPEVLQTIRRLLIRPGRFRLERELPGGIRTHDICAPWQGTQWNRIEHRLFAFITQNWRGKPLVSHQVIVQLIANTPTDTGLTVALPDSTPPPTRRASRFLTPRCKPQHPTRQLPRRMELYPCSKDT